MIKLIIWDLDDTLWRGTLADGEVVELFQHRAAMIRDFNRRGVVSAICSKNDFETAKAKLVAFGLWDEFVFPHIAFTPKPAAIRAIIEDMQLRPANALFVDDNPLNLNEARFALPELNLLDITAEGADSRLGALLAEQKGTRSRVADYRILEAKKRDRGAITDMSNEDFLRSCEIKLCAPYEMANLDYVDRIVELVNRSNQLNYTKSRVTANEIRDNIIDVMTYGTFSVFAWDKYGDYGLVGFVMVRKTDAKLVHFVFSCRAMHMGIEQYMLDRGFATAREIWSPFHADSDWLGDRFSRVDPDWIETARLDDPKVRARIDAMMGVQPGEADIRIMATCQSGGIAHFSEYRSQMRVDSMPDVFILSDFHFQDRPEQHYPPYLVYHAGADYANPPWRLEAGNAEIGLFAWCVERFCEHLVRRGVQMLVILPSEDLADEMYFPKIGMYRGRVKAFNSIWREAHRIVPGISILDVAQLHGPEELRDVSHHHPNSLRKIASVVDGWYEQVSSVQTSKRAA